MNEKIERLRDIKRVAKDGGGKDKIDKEHAKGKLTARERINALFDEGTFQEFNMLVKHKIGAAGDGIVIGHGLVNGRRVCAFAHDVTVLGASQGYFHGKKLYKIYEFALKFQVPIIGLNDSPGARVLRPELAGSDDPYRVSDEKHAGVVFYMNTKASGVIPQISAILGNCTGGSVYSPALTDFIFMVDNISHMFITGPKVIESVTGEKISMEDLGSSKVHTQKTGVADLRFENEVLCFDNIKKLLSFLPSNCYQNPPILAECDDFNRLNDKIEDIIPYDPSKPYDMKRVIYEIVDNGDFFEVKPEYAKEIITGFARFNGHPFGIVANQPIEKAGCMTINSSWKQARFIRFCNNFNIPILLLVDTPGYLPGKDQEHNAIIRHGAKTLYALSEADVPKIAILIRKVYGGAALGMGVLPGFGTDMVFALPYAEIGAMGAEQAVNLFYKDEINNADDKKTFKIQKVKEYKEHYSDTFAFASDVTYVEDIIEPGEMRGVVINSYQLLKNKAKRKRDLKFGNIPL